MKTVSYFARYNKRPLMLAVALPLLAMLVLSTPALAAPVVTLTPTTGAVGTKVTVYGTVFDSYKGDTVYIFFDNTEIPSSPIEVPDTGYFTTDFIVPADAEPGRHWVRVKSEADSTSFLAETFFIIEEVEITLDVIDGPVGTEVTISGRGFYADRTVTLYYQTIIKEKLGTKTASAIGEFSYQFTIPNSTAGLHKITVANAEGNSAETKFEVIPSIALNLSSASPGELLTIRGTGFGYRGEVDIDFGIRPVARAKTNEYGIFEVVFNIPEVQPATYDVKALDEYGNMDNAKFITTAGINLDQITGSVSSKLTVRGSGFKITGTVNIDYDNLRVATATTDNNGAFSVTFNVPASNSGDHVITVSDGEITKKLAFTVESEAPPVPSLLLPADKSDTRAKAYLDWQDVTDPSPPVTYNLQVASDLNFASLVLGKYGLTDSEYALTEKEQLSAARQNTPYYWRVKAIDSAKNESEWSAPWSLYISTPPVPKLIMPASDSMVETPLLFNWQSVTSLSPPVTYVLQVASDLNFISLVLEKYGLADSAYILTAEEELPAVNQESPYYWRVKSIDNANNESEWSAPWSLYTDSPFTLPGWVIYTLIAIVVIAVAYLAFRVGRRTAYRPPE